MSISVCMATYNGEKYVATQIRSILDQLGAGDEIIVVDDSSKDRTVGKLRDLDDPRIRIYTNTTNKREVYTFGQAMSLARNEYIFLSDQDDIWIPGRVDLMRQAMMKSRKNMVCTNFEWMDANERYIDIPFDGVRSPDSDRIFKNIADIFVGKTNYFGCAMAIHRNTLPVVLPIPEYVESHDLWIALAGNIMNSMIHLDAKTLRKRLHDNNATSVVSNRSLYLKLRARAIFLRSILEIKRRMDSNHVQQKKYSLSSGA